MEAIREYLRNLFMGLPETPEVLRAKAELLEIMEDKYDELIRNGKTEKEAIGIVISEFGDLQELAGELGIEDYMKNMQDNAGEQFADGGSGGMGGTGGFTGNIGGPDNVETVYRWSFDGVKKYISYTWTHGMLIAAAVMICICTPFAETVFEACGQTGYMPQVIAKVVGISLFFLLIGVAVILFCIAYEMKKKYGKMRYGIILDVETEKYVVQKEEKDTHLRLVQRFAGIFLCIVSVVPSSVNYFSNPFLSEIIDSSVLLIAGIGVFFIVLSVSVGNRYKELAKAMKKAENTQGAYNVYNLYKGEYRVSKGKMPIAATVILFLFGAIVIGGTVAANIAYISWQDNGGQVVHNNDEYEFDNVNSVMIDMDLADLQIIKDSSSAGSGKVRVEYSGNSLYMPEVVSSNGRLNIRDRRNKGFRFFSFNIGWITRPAENLGNLTVILPDSSDMKEYDMNIDVDAGNVSCSGVCMSNLNIDLDAGNVKIENCNVGGKAAVDVDLGNLEVYESAIGHLKGDIDAGNAGYYVTGNTLNTYDMDLDVEMGNISINNDNRGGMYKQTPETGTATGGSSRKIQIEVDMGDINIEIPEQ